LKLVAGSGSALLGAGLHAPVPAVDINGTTRLEFALELVLQGTSQFHVTPVGRETQILLSSNWPHPSFTGEYLPVQHEIGAGGFSARWATSFFSTNLEEALQKCAVQSSCEDLNARHLGVSFVDPVDQYLKSDRAIKYGLLFIALTFAGFFLFEVLKKLAVHPIQYAFVGAGLALFYLLLLSLAEHVGFALAYALSSAACVALIGFYVGHVLQSHWRGLGFACALTALYGALYGLLSADDYALLMGSLLLFGLLTAVMVLTRKVNWFSLGTDEATS
jgi:inner membrane protein